MSNALLEPTVEASSANVLKRSPNRIDLNCILVLCLYCDLKPSIVIVMFYLRDVVSAVLATATWLAGWLGGCLSHAGIVSKRLNLS